MPRPIRYITTAQRQQIELLYAYGCPVKNISEQTGVSTAALYVELRRGQDGTINANFRPTYRASLAEESVRAGFARRGKKKKDEAKTKVH